MKFVVLSLLALYSGFAAADQCSVTRASFDIGSGKTSMKVAEVDTCLQKITNFKVKEVVKIDFNGDLKKSGNGELSQAIIDQAIGEFKKLTDKAKAAGATEIHGIATEAIRKAKNGDVLASRALGEASLPMESISQDEEAQVGFAGAAAATGLDKDKIVVWDIGGGSVQISTRTEDQKLISYSSLVASRSARDFIIGEVKGLDTKSVQTPNPIGLEHITPSISDVSNHLEAIPPEIAKKVNDPQVRVVGIGPVFGLSVSRQVGLPILTEANLVSTLQTQVLLTDEKLGGKYPDTDVSNIILVLSSMRKFGISSVQVVDVDLNEGELVNPKFWAK